MHVRRSERLSISSGVRGRLRPAAGPPDTIRAEFPVAFRSPPLAKKSRDRNRPATAPKVAVAPASPDGPNRKVRKEEARQQREAIQRRMARRRTYRIVAAVVAVLVVAGATTFVLLNKKSNTSATSRVDPATLPGIMRTAAPWNTEFQDLNARLNVLGFPVLTKEATAYHIHQNLRI